MKSFYVHFADDPRKEIPKLTDWRAVKAKSYQDAALIALKEKLPWDGFLYAHVHGFSDPKHENGAPMVCHTFTLNIEGRA